MKRSFIERAIGRWLEGHSVIPIIPHIAKPYDGFDSSPYEKRQPTIFELFSWSGSEEYKDAGVGIVTTYEPDPHKTLEIIRGMGNLNQITDVPVFILAMLKEAIKNSSK